MLESRAKVEFRTPELQAAFMVRKVLEEHQDRGDLDIPELKEVNANQE